jgi:RNA polymerase sigma-70 factor (ECF subfamily)
MNRDSNKGTGAVSAQDPTTLDRAEEAVLVERARRGDCAAARRLIDCHRDRLFAFIRRMVRHHHDTEEICQEAFLKAFASLDGFLSEYRFSTWLFTIGYRVCLNWLRRRRTVSISLNSSSFPDAGDEDVEREAASEDVARLKEIIWKAVDQLTPPQRASVLLFYRHEQGCHEIAQVLGLPVATVKSHLHRARERLRVVLEPVVTERDTRWLRNLAG